MLSAGQRVTLAGINGAPQYNGKSGQLRSQREDGRWFVRLDDGNDIAVRPECCQALSAENVGYAVLGAALSTQSEVPLAGQPCSIFSVSANQWIEGVVQTVTDGQVIVDYISNGRSVSKQLPLDHPHLKLNSASGQQLTRGSTQSLTGAYPGGLANLAGLPNQTAQLGGIRNSVVSTSTQPGGLRNSVGLTNGVPNQTVVATQSSSRYRVCLEGTKCSRRDPEHLEGFAHCFDPDYEMLCQKCSVPSEQIEIPSIRALFRWLDSDNSGKLSIEEIQEGLALIQELTGDDLHVSLESIDEDGNGAVNFSEFAEWAGPRLHLPLGIDLTRRPTQGGGTSCGILGCPCMEYRERTAPPKKKTKKKKSLFGAMIKVTVNALKEVLNDGETFEMSTQICQCGHKKTAHRIMNTSLPEAPFPVYWNYRHDANDHFTGTKCTYNELVYPGREILQHFQQLFDHTYKNVWTRDRKKHQNAPVPKGYRVVYALRNENCSNWLNYNLRRSALLADAEEEPIAPMSDHADVKSNAWQQICPFGAEPLAEACNEFYLFHGCSGHVAESICRTDFKIGLAGKNTGTLYGGGTYFAESITKADEYTQQNERGQYAVLLCRCLGGKVLYTDEVEPDPELLTQSCISGPYDCVVGDREKCRGTYKEFVFYDAEDIYPEYIIFYERL